MEINLHQNLRTLHERIAEAESRYGRTPGSVSLLAVSKTHPSSKIETLFHAGQTAFGENYVQEAIQKITALHTLPLEWHYIGALQTNKANIVATHFQWVHTVSRIIEAQKLAQFRPSANTPLNICLQVKLDERATKSGASPEQIISLAEAVRALPSLRLRGLMVIPPVVETFSEQRQLFSQVRVLFEQLNAMGFTLDTLSMGMTHDFEAAIAEGATLIRIGTGLFGSRG